MLTYTDIRQANLPVPAGSGARSRIRCSSRKLKPEAPNHQELGAQTGDLRDGGAGLAAEGQVDDHASAAYGSSIVSTFHSPGMVMGIQHAECDQQAWDSTYSCSAYNTFSVPVNRTHNMDILAHHISLSLEATGTCNIIGFRWCAVEVQPAEHMQGRAMHALATCGQAVCTADGHHAYFITISVHLVFVRDDQS